MSKPALLALANGTIMTGISIGVPGITVGELVFNTCMSGYQEILTDPSYARQMVTFTYPHIGNVGINFEDVESTRMYCAGVVMREMPTKPSNYRAQGSLEEYLKQQSAIAIAGVDTRELASIIRDQGAQHACILAGEYQDEVLSAELALEKAREFEGLNGLDLALDVTTPAPYSWTEQTWRKRYEIDPRYLAHAKDASGRHVVVYDYGVKHNILRMLADRGVNITVVPATTPFSQVQALRPDGVLFSNGPGDPAACHYAIKAIQECLAADIPLLGICLGFQILALACGAKTEKMAFGHHGVNHPVQCLENQRVFITAQNHSFSVDEKTLPESLVITHRSLFDGTIQGFRHRTKKAFGFQGHPEASGGPLDVSGLFDQFLEMM